MVSGRLVLFCLSPVISRGQLIVWSDNLPSMDNLDQIADGLRSVLQSTLREFIRSREDRETLAKVLGRTPGHIKQMIYKGEGGLDSWVKAFAFCYKFDRASLDGLKHDLRKRRPIAESDTVWFKIRDQLGADEPDLVYLARCAHEAYRIKRDLEDSIGIKRSRRRTPINSTKKE